MFSSLISQCQIDDPNQELRILRKEIRMNSMFISNLHEEIKILQSQNKDFVKKMQDLQENTSNDKIINTLNTQKFDVEHNLETGIIDNFVRFILNQCQTASK